MEIIYFFKILINLNYLESVLQDVEDARQRKEAEKAERRAKILEANRMKKAGERVAQGHDLQGMAKMALERGDQFGNENGDANMEIDTNNVEVNS